MHQIRRRQLLVVECAGYAMSHAVEFDVIVEYLITDEKHDVFKTNEVLVRV